MVARRFTPWVCVLAVVFVGACADDPIAYSEVVSTKLSGFKPGDFKNNVVSEDKNINTESGNPYGVFLKNAKDALGGRTPSAIEVTQVYVRVRSDSKDVTAVDQVLADLEVFIATSETTIPIGAVTAPTGAEVLVPLRSNIDYAPVRARTINGDFKVGLRGSGVAPLPADFDLKVSLDMRFQAFE